MKNLEHLNWSQWSPSHDVNCVESRQIVDKLLGLITHFIVLPISDNDPFVHICPVALYRDDWIQDNNGLSISTSTQ